VKRLVAIAFIFLLSAQCIFKLTIITYFQANRDYIAEALCVNREKPMTLCMGQCFLDRNLSLADDETPKQAPTATKLSVDAPVFLVADFQLSLNRNPLDVENSNAPQPLYNFYSQKPFFHPPC
jgi:hypothetical protein